MLEIDMKKKKKKGTIGSYRQGKYFNLGERSIRKNWEF